MSAHRGDTRSLLAIPAVRWLIWGALIVLLAGWEPGTEQVRHLLTAASLVLIAALLMDVVVTTVIAAGGRAKQNLADRRNRTHQPGLTTGRVRR
ncbi:hypothetical protein M3G04_01505 [Dietzia cinnamea]|uniref:hypothetical protein n=1 Tax=Dietzia cinnamea TaxID=321318 RepID=UPI00223A9632|nr:hypothetical protein [Dietzia cinnamea]MCT2299585.1 hypothetical protein [Dietzia cinnamea]